MNIISRIIKAGKLSCLGILLLFSSCSKSVDNQTIVFKDVNIITMVNDSILYGHSVLVKDNKIADIGIFDEMEIPKDAHLINGKEQFLIPGLCDMHAHYNEDDNILYVANGVTLVRNMWGDSFHLISKDKIKKKCIIGPELYTTGALIDGLNPRWPGSLVINDKEKVFEALSQMKKDGYDAIKVYEKLTKEVYDEIIRVAKELEMPVVGHVPESMHVMDVLLSGQHSIEHFDGYEKFDTDDELVAKTIKSDIWNCPTLLLFKNFKNLNNLKKNPPSEIKYMSQFLIKRWENTNQFDEGVFEKKMQLLKILANNNANIVTGTDTQNEYVVPGFSLHKELSIWQDAGLTPYQILLAATRNCAEMLGYESRLGTIEKHKDADLVLLKNNPLEDIKNTKSIVGVMTKGSWHAKAELDLMLDEVAAKHVSAMQKTTIRNNHYMKLLVLVMFLTLLSTFVIRPVLFVFNKRQLESIKSTDSSIKKYRIRFLVILISTISLIILALLAILPEYQLQYGIPTIFTPDLLTRCKMLIPFVNLILLAALSILFSIALLRNDLSSFRKWHTLSIISVSTILFVLLNYWGLLRLLL